MSKLHQLKELSSDLVQRYDLQLLGVFGSVARGEELPESDLDLLVEFKHGDETGVADRFFAFLKEVKETFGCEVDLITSRDIKNPYLKRAVERDLVVLHG